VGKGRSCTVAKAVVGAEEAHWLGQEIWCFQCLPRAMAMFVARMRMGTPLPKGSDFDFGRFNVTEPV
jgi:hypothetical protein